MASEYTYSPCMDFFIERLALGAGLLLQFQQLLQHRVDMILLLDRDVGQQVVMLLAQKGEEVHLREDFGNLAQILGS